jgi:hypothetical protein
LKIVLLLLFLPLSLWSQSVEIRGISMAKELKNGSRPVFVEISVANDGNNPVKMDPRLFYLVPDQGSQHFPLLEGTGEAAIAVSPGQRTSQKLSFEVAPDIEVKSMKLCYHSPEDKSWSDYLEILFSWPAPVKAPMWHPASPDQTSAAMAYIPAKDAAKQPKLVHSTNPILPPGGRQRLIDAGGLIASVVSLVVDKDGKPQQLSVATPAGFGFDKQAIKEAMHYRFEPARDASGAPIAVETTVRVVFRSY